MTRYTGGTQVGGGYYWNARGWEVEVVPDEGGTLRGSAETRYVKVPFPALFVVVPLLGALFLMFMPLVGFALFAYAVARKVTGGVRQGATELASTVQPGQFAPGAAYFTGKPGEEEKRAEGAAAANSPELEELEQEIAARKEQK